MENAPSNNEASSGTSALNDGLGVIVFDGKRFVEAKQHGNAPPNYACDGCAFIRKPRYCDSAIEYKAKAAFGGDCDERDVIYVEAPNAKVSGAGTASAGLPGYTLPCEET